MKSKFTLLLAIALMFTATGCHLFSRSKKPRNPAIAADVESDFRVRWVDQRIGQLKAAGTDEAAARQQAETEFREKFPYLQKNKK